MIEDASPVMQAALGTFFTWVSVGAWCGCLAIACEQSMVVAFASRVWVGPLPRLARGCARPRPAVHPDWCARTFDAAQGVTAAGAAIVFIANKDRGLLDAALGFSAGVMIAASYWSLLAPAIEMAEESGTYGKVRHATPNRSITPPCRRAVRRCGVCGVCVCRARTQTAASWCACCERYSAHSAALPWCVRACVCTGARVRAYCVLRVSARGNGVGAAQR